MSYLIFNITYPWIPYCAIRAILSIKNITSSSNISASLLTTPQHFLCLCQIRIKMYKVILLSLLRASSTSPMIDDCICVAKEIQFQIRFCKFTNPDQKYNFLINYCKNINLNWWCVNIATDYKNAQNYKINKIKCIFLMDPFVDSRFIGKSMTFSANISEPKSYLHSLLPSCQ